MTSPTTESKLKFERLTVAQLMEKDVQYGHLQTKADVLASLMVEGFGSVPIVDEKQRLVGMVTEFDLLAVLGRGKKWSELCAHDIMTRHPASVTKATGITTLIGVLQSNHFIRMPVVDSEGKLIGIVARRDILRGYLNAEGDPDWSDVVGYW